VDSILRRVSLRDLTLIFFKRKWGMLTIILVAMLGAATWVLLIRDDLFEVSAKVLVKLGQEQAPPATVMGLPPQVIGYRNQDVNSEVDIIVSTELLAQVVDLLQLDQPPPPVPPPDGLLPWIRHQGKNVVRVVRSWWNETLLSLGLRFRLTPREAAIAMLQQAVTVKAQRDSNVITIEMVVPARERSSLILNTLLDLYLKFRVKLYTDPGAVPFFETEFKAAAENLRAAEAELRRFEVQGEITELQKQKEVLLANIAASQVMLQSAKIAFQEAAAKVQRLDQEMRKNEPNFAGLGAFPKDTFPQNVLLQLADLQKERERLRMTDLDRGPRIQNNRSQFGILMGLLRSNLLSVRAETETEYRTRTAEVTAMQARLRALHDKDMEWTALKRKIRVSEDSYVFYRKKLEESSATASFRDKNIGNVVIVERAMDPFQTVGVRKMTLLGLSGLIAFLAALAWVAVAEFFDDGVYTSYGLEKYIGAPVVAVIPTGAGAVASSIWMTTGRRRGIDGRHAQGG